MPSFDLSADEASLIIERRGRAAKLEADRIESEARIDVFAMTTQEILALSPERRALALRQNLELAQRGE